jgi:hypothetical protein
MNQINKLESTGRNFPGGEEKKASLYVQTRLEYLLIAHHPLLSHEGIAFLIDNSMGSQGEKEIIYLRGFSQSASNLELEVMTRQIFRELFGDVAEYLELEFSFRENELHGMMIIALKFDLKNAKRIADHLKHVF